MINGHKWLLGIHRLETEFQFQATSESDFSISYHGHF